MPETTVTTDIDALLKTATPEAANALQDIADSADSKEAKKAAKRALYLLSQKGIAPTAASQVAPPKNAVQETIRFLMSNIDGAGNQMLWFVLPDLYGGRPLLFSVLASDEEGVKDFIAVKMPMDEIEKSVAEYGSRMSASFTDAPLDYGRWLVSQAREINREKLKPTPKGFLEHAARLGEPQRQYDAPPRDVLPSAEAVEADETFPRDAAALFAKPVFDAWFLGMDIILPELAQWMKSMAISSDESADEMQHNRDAMIARVTEKVVTPGIHARYVNRLLMSATVLWKNGEEETAKQALFHAHRLQTESANSDFAAALMRRTLEAAREMLINAMQQQGAE